MMIDSSVKVEGQRSKVEGGVIPSEARDLLFRRSAFDLRPLTLAILVAVACGPTPAPSTAPSPTAPQPSSPGAQAAPPLPAIPTVDGPLAIRVQYPSANQALTSRDSNFIFGSVGTGKATLTINGAPARVYPNGAFLAWIPVPPAANPRYELVARTSSDSARMTLPVRVPSPRTVLALDGPLVVDSNSVSPRGAMRLRNDDPVRISVRAPANATAWVALTGESRLLANAPLGIRSDSTLFATDVFARDLYAPAQVVVARGADTVRLPLARIEPADTGLTRLVRIGDLPVIPDTDRVINGRPVINGTYKWFFLPGTVLQETGRMAGYTRVKLDDQLDVWVADADTRPLPPSAVMPRRTALNARVRAGAEWVDVVIPMAERPAYFVEEGARELSVILYGVRGNTDIVQIEQNDTLVRTLSWTQESNDRARFTIRLGQALYGYQVMWDDAQGFVVRVRRKPSIDSSRPLRGLLIAVDPGHPPIGATGPTGFYEGDAVLQVGMRLKTMLESRGATVYMTRTTPEPVDLALRPVLARRANANAFVSIHLNAYPDGVNIFTAQNGTGTYYFHDLSEPLARPVQRGLVQQMGLPNLGAYFDNLAVVRQTWMPSVLTEGAFVIVPEQESALRTPEFQDRYARGIADGLEEYFRWLARQ